MNFKKYSSLNNIIGWSVFAIATIVYLLTIEHTVSLWDCGEFVSCDYKLEIPHPPGAPFYTLIYRMFAMIANPTYSHAAAHLVPIFVNAASALNSSFTILFLFWTITALGIKVFGRNEENMDKGLVYAIFGAGIVGGLAYTFSDTFWFSAVEAEVYAMSSMFTALIFWLALKWERRANEPHNLRWIVLIFYLVGLAIGVHLLGLLVIPAIVMIFYFKKYANPNVKGALVALLISFVILAVVQYGIIIYLPKIASWFELRFVNDMGMPMWSGVLFFYALLFAGLAYGIYWSHINKKLILNISLVCFTTVLIGFSSYAMSVIRSYANPPIDMNDPEDIFSLVGYLGREQYGDNYLLKGPIYTAYTDRAYTTKEGANIWRRQGNKYVKDGKKITYEFNSAYTTIFPRMYNGTQDNYINGYRYWGNVKNNNKISFINNNMRFFLSYQVGYMYGRYFAWNFIGRQNDIQGFFGEFHQGNWMTGIPFIDDKILGLGPQDNLPYYLKANRARNLLFGLPFLLGILGLLYHYRRNRKDFLTVLVFFFMTGLAIEIYLNMPSPQPRERDYAFVGSFYVYAIWIGFGVLWVYDLLRKKMAGVSAASVATVICLIAVPVLMASQEWDDHDRSHRTASRDYGVNYLQSCAPNAVLFTNGDNDTYPLWYLQEVEGVRDDVRIINLSLFGTDWYINQMRTPINNAPALKFTLSAEQTAGWDYLPYEASLVSGLDQTQYMDIFKVLNFIGSKDPRTKANTYSGESIPFMPTQKLRIPVNKDIVLKNKTVSAEDADRVVDYIDVDISKTAILKNQIMLLDFIATNQFEYPIYFSITSGQDEYLSLGPYLRQEGLTYRLVPIKYGSSSNDEKYVATDIMYENIKNKFEWGKLDVNTTYVDYVLARQASNLRGVMQTLARTLAKEGENAKAIEIVDMALEKIPNRNVPYDYYVTLLADVYYHAGANDKAKALALKMIDMTVEELDYYSRVEPSKLVMVDHEIRQGLNTLRILNEDAMQAQQKDVVDKIKPQLDRFTQQFGGM